jgi:hypothetical protein
MALQQALINLGKARRAFFEKRARYPRFKSRHGRQSSYRWRSRNYGRRGTASAAATRERLWRRHKTAGPCLPQSPVKEKEAPDLSPGSITEEERIHMTTIRHAYIILTGLIVAASPAMASSNAESEESEAKSLIGDTCGALETFLGWGEAIVYLVIALSLILTAVDAFSGKFNTSRLGTILVAAFFVSTLQLWLAFFSPAGFGDCSAFTGITDSFGEQSDFQQGIQR